MVDGCWRVARIHFFTKHFFTKHFFTKHVFTKFERESMLTKSLFGIVAVAVLGLATLGAHLSADSQQVTVVGSGQPTAACNCCENCDNPACECAVLGCECSVNGPRECCFECECCQACPGCTDVCML
jgi:hypothetical protein